MAEMISSKLELPFERICISDHSLSAETVGNNEDLLREILLRVPAKSLVRFLCISKHWFALISDSNFAANHAHKNFTYLASGLYMVWSGVEIKPALLCENTSMPRFDFLDDIKLWPEAGFILDSRNGLYLWLYISGLFICNPTTRKYMILPEIDLTHLGSDFNEFGPYLDFDPSKSSHYKVVLICFSVDVRSTSLESFHEINIFSSESGYWKKIYVTAPPVSRSGRNAYWNGAIHWMSKGNIHFMFDINTQTLTQIDMPQGPPSLYGNQILYFGESGAHLLLIQHGMRFLGLQIFEMDQDNYCWIIKYDFCFHDSFVALNDRENYIWTNNFGYDDYLELFNERDIYWGSYLLRILCVLKGEETEDGVILVIAGAFKVCLYNLKSESWDVLRVFSRHETDKRLSICAYRLNESLSPV